MMYFPALSLPNEEQVFVNMGERPFKFPLQGAKSIIDNPTVLINYFKHLEVIVDSLLDSQINLQSIVSSVYLCSNLLKRNNLVISNFR